MSPGKYVWNRYVLALLLVAAAVGGYLWWKTLAQPAAAQRYKTQAVERGNLTQTVSANGTLNPVVLVSVGTQVSGTVKTLHADFNDHVRQGQVLLELDPQLFEAQVAQSEANVKNAQASLDLAAANEARMRDLFAQEYVSKQELDQSVQALKSARAQLELARAQLRKDRTNLGYSVIRSPVSGVVVNRTVDVGQTVAASFQTPTLFQIAQDLRQMQIDSAFAEADIGQIKAGQAVRFNVDAFPNRTFHANVRKVRLNPTTQQNVVTYDVVVAVDNPEQILMPGMTAYVNVIVAERDNALLVPNAALRFKPAEAKGKAKEKAERGGTARQAHEGSTATVYVLEQGRLKPVRVQTGITDNRLTEVVAGDLKEGDQVVVEDTQAAGEKQSGGTMRVRMF
jgi:HlyD family secretion protein